jgi:outer membrane receptor protein involved in Fe transport
LGANFFHPSGLGAFVTGTYYKQDGLFDGFTSGQAGSDSDSFWLLDLGLRYRLPKRYGLFTVGVSNVTDKKFNYFDTDILNASIQPDRVVFGKLTLALP